MQAHQNMMQQMQAQRHNLLTQSRPADVGCTVHYEQAHYAGQSYAGQNHAGQNPAYQGHRNSAYQQGQNHAYQQGQNSAFPQGAPVARDIPMGQPVANIPNDQSMSAAIPMGRVISTEERFVEEGEHMHNPPQ